MKDRLIYFHNRLYPLITRASLGERSPLSLHLKFLALVIIRKLTVNRYLHTIIMSVYTLKHFKKVYFMFFEYMQIKNGKWFMA